LHLSGLKFNLFFQGGVHLTKDPSKVPELVNAMIGHRLITKQTPADGIPVSKVCPKNHLTVGAAS
jgi:succinyl-CoA synthetase beta subunit